MKIKTPRDSQVEARYIVMPPQQHSEGNRGNRDFLQIDYARESK